MAAPRLVKTSTTTPAIVASPPDDDAVEFGRGEVDRELRLHRLVLGAVPHGEGEQHVALLLDGERLEPAESSLQNRRTAVVLKKAT